jgi:drug/metabolite transporter (DMT)-like permease
MERSARLMRSSRTRGIGFMLLASLLFSLNDAASKWMTSTYPAGEIIFVRSLSLIAVLLLSGLGARTFDRLHPSSLRNHVARGVFYVLSALCFVVSLKLLSLPVAVAVALASPLIVTALAGWMLGERVDWRHWSAVVVGLLGVALVTDPFASDWTWGVLVAFAGAIFGALKDIATRKMSSSETTSSILFFGVVLLAAASLSTAPFGWKWPTHWHLMVFAFVGLTLGLAQHLLIEAFRLCEASVVSPIQYSMLVWSMLFGYAFWGDVPSAYSLVGSCAIVASSAYIMLTAGASRSPELDTKVSSEI